MPAGVDKTDPKGRKRGLLRGPFFLMLGAVLRLLRGTVRARSGARETNEADLERRVVWRIIENRACLLKDAMQRLGSATGLKDEGEPGDRLLRMVATDLFVEKAQRFLTERASVLFRYGLITLALGIVVLASGGSLTWSLLHATPTDLTGYQLTLRLVQSSAFAGFVLWGAFVLNSFSRAFFHEGTKLRDRRHALRFGRLYMYLTKDEIDAVELERVFEWNRDTVSEFQRIRDISPETLHMKLMSILPDLLKSLQSEKTAEEKDKGPAKSTRP